mgnify:CR=1 FL=1
MAEQTTDPPFLGAADDMAAQSHRAAAFLKALSHEARLLILCHLVEGDKTVTELVSLMSLRQAAVSQHLARLRADGLVTARRDGKSVVYTITDDRALRLVGLLHELFCHHRAGP